MAARPSILPQVAGQRVGLQGVPSEAIIALLDSVMNIEEMGPFGCWVVSVVAWVGGWRSIGRQTWITCSTMGSFRSILQTCGWVKTAGIPGRGGGGGTHPHPTPGVSLKSAALDPRANPNTPFSVCYSLVRAGRVMF